MAWIRLNFDVVGETQDDGCCICSHEPNASWVTKKTYFSRFICVHEAAAMIKKMMIITNKLYEKHVPFGFLMSVFMTESGFLFSSHSRSAALSLSLFLSVALVVWKSR